MQNKDGITTIISSINNDRNINEQTAVTILAKK